MNENKSTTINTIKERVVKLETQYQFICEKLYDIQNNDLVHMNKKLDEIDDKCNNLDKKVGEMAIKVGIIFAVATAVAEAIIRTLIK